MHWQDIIFDAVGIIGVALILSAYFLLQQGRLTAQMIVYPLLNLVGAALLLVSLLWSWNLPSVIIELCWVAISLYGIWRIKRGV